MVARFQDDDYVILNNGLAWNAVKGEWDYEENATVYRGWSAVVNASYELGVPGTKIARVVKE